LNGVKWPAHLLFLDDHKPAWVLPQQFFTVLVEVLSFNIKHGSLPALL